MPVQPSLFGVVASDPTPEDLAGLLAGPAELGRMGGTARVSVTVDAAWRVHVLAAELALRRLPASWEPSGEAFVVHSAYTTRLLGLAAAWRDGPPAGLHLNGQALRLWVAAAGTPSDDGFLLGLRRGSNTPPAPLRGAPPPPKAGESAWSAVGAALSAAGLAAALVVAGPAYRITGRRRLARLAELVGDPPPTVPSDSWPTFSGRS
jgi:hypothetical protein